MVSWLDIAMSIKYNNISDQELKELLNKKKYPSYNSVTDPYNVMTSITDINTFEAFHNASINQLGLLLERFPELLNDLGHYFAYYGKMDSVNFLIEKGCDINIVAIGIIKGLREMEARSLSSSFTYFPPEKTEEMHQLKMNFLKNLCEGSVDKDLIYSETMEYFYNKVFFINHNYHIEQAKKFYESGTFKAAEKALEIINPNKSFKDELLNRLDGQVMLNEIIDIIFSSAKNLELVAPKSEDSTEESAITIAENFAEADSINLMAIGKTQYSNSEDFPS